MLKYLTHELDKDNRDYRRFFRVEMCHFLPFLNLEI